MKCINAYIVFVFLFPVLMFGAESSKVPAQSGLSFIFANRPKKSASIAAQDVDLVISQDVECLCALKPSSPEAIHRQELKACDSPTGCTRKLWRIPAVKSLVQ